MRRFGRLMLRAALALGWAGGLVGVGFAAWAWRPSPTADPAILVASTLLRWVVLALDGWLLVGSVLALVASVVGPLAPLATHLPRFVRRAATGGLALTLLTGSLGPRQHATASPVSVAVDEAPLEDEARPQLPTGSAELPNLTPIRPIAPAGPSHGPLPSLSTRRAPPPAIDPRPVTAPGNGIAAGEDDDSAGPPIRHTVRPGDSFWLIAESVIGQDAPDRHIARYWAALVDANRDRLVAPGDPDLIYPGQVLVVPAADGRSSSP